MEIASKSAVSALCCSFLSSHLLLGVAQSVHEKSSIK